MSADEGAKTELVEGVERRPSGLFIPPGSAERRAEQQVNPDVPLGARCLRCRHARQWHGSGHRCDAVTEQYADMMQQEDGTVKRGRFYGGIALCACPMFYEEEAA